MRRVHKYKIIDPDGCVCSKTVSTNAATSWCDAAADDYDDDVDDDHGPGMMEKPGLRFTHDEKPSAHSLLLLTHYLISLHSVAARVCCLFCACCSLSLQPPLLVPCISVLFISFPGEGSHAGNDDSDIRC